MKDTVVIFGSFPDTREGFQWNRQDCDLWVFNEAIGANNTWVQWCTGILQMHVPAIFRNPLNRNDKEHYQWLKNNDATPVYMQDKYPEIPMSIKYPLDEIISTLLPNFRKDKNEVWDDHGGYFTSTLAEAIALAIYLGYKRIELWGIGLAVGTEYIYQRPGATFWIGIALGRGIEVVLKGSWLDAPLYGYNGDLFIPLEKFTARVEEISKMLPPVKEEHEGQKTALTQALMKLKEKRIDEKELRQALNLYSKSINDLAVLTGILEENQFYITKAHEMMKAGGDNDFRFARSEFESRFNNYNKQIRDMDRARNLELLKLDEAFKAIAKASGYKKRCQAVDTYTSGLDKDIETVARTTSMSAMVTENKRYMSILDEQYRAAGGKRAVEMLEGRGEEA